MIHRIRIMSHPPERLSLPRTIAQIIDQIRELDGPDSYLDHSMCSSQGILEFMCDIEPETATILAMAWPGIRVDSRYFA
jgi:hypothetical protein